MWPFWMSGVCGAEKVHSFCRFEKLWSFLLNDSDCLQIKRKQNNSFMKVYTLYLESVHLRAPAEHSNVSISAKQWKIHHYFIRRRAPGK